MPGRPRQWREIAEELREEAEIRELKLDYERLVLKEEISKLQGKLSLHSASIDDIVCFIHNYLIPRIVKLERK